MENLQNIILAIVLTALVAYLLGSVNSSILITRIFGQKTDIRQMGSGNAGATNVLRSVGRLPAALTFIFDFLKCVLAVLAGRAIFSYFFQIPAISPMVIEQTGAYIAGIVCILGHIYPLYFGFRGGKGVTTSIAMIMIIDWRVSLIVWAAFFLAVFCSKMVSLGSVCGAGIYPFATFFLTFFYDYRSSATVPLSYVVVATVSSFIIGCIVIIKHRGNIKRILDGTEKKVSLRSRKAPPQ
ncbi:glycerol-3-phosphate 1-O-acyltransferase PlsY [Faecalispora jeddahensis]|uniref:glycerol-3-phosphate 1-O-acyltransferase PlsY n=1 Tax=Faecalispora jeddahensis TaxID=1414721 RepID=UPI00189ACD6F|nr:glycerol-3-phosphate 1-O-acyltransferase PlsY [Faecalispora jeddahensis]